VLGACEAGFPVTLLLGGCRWFWASGGAIVCIDNRINNTNELGGMLRSQEICETLECLRELLYHR
jgi:hypothetical protein